MNPAPDEALLVTVAGAHRDQVDARELPRVRSLPRHRARRTAWKPPLEPTHAQHTYDRDPLAS